MRKFLLAAVAAISAGSAYAQSPIVVNASPNINVLTQLMVTVPVNVSPATAVAVSVYGNSAAKANTINFQGVSAANQGWINTNFVSGF
ncbi:hypothetical protein OGR47_09220 [Methylocystis sp. MJC1]|jgi:hypothetical protein|uniref:hypothetical protein n=1 Tax=Methylocystis sp. MJC1 TaxID=2654282 RepID=UPI0013E9A31A|nr:hypothetical protein [Methylocystis sp. MJC1]KAF2991594.1 hypothetical protein MJC1_01159 [Methylocystis sp. MJC1]MBU6527167.1 hypothetical protein [Methylocystis sp. MJC1]UZX13600.1 hypothetical protein OGR47_09220 [Methylocystis sp. MJC1]